MRGSTTLWIAGLAAILAAGSLACGEAKVTHPTSAKAFQSAAEAQDGEVVATVGERQISLAEFEAYWQAHPELEREEALDKIIERELWVGEALERGLGDNPELSVARKRAMVRELLDEQVEAEVTADDITDEELAKEVEALEQRVGHAAGIRASHLVVLVPPDKQKKASKEQAARWFDTARAEIDKVLEQLPEEPDIYDLLDARDTFAGKLPEPLDVQVNLHLVFPLIEEGESVGDLPEGWQPVVPAFRDAAADLVRNGQMGELSEPVKTRFGWHVIIAEATLPGKEPDADALRELARWRLLRKERNERFTELMQKWSDGVEMQTFPNVVSEAEEFGD